MNKEKIAILTDSASDVPQDIIDKFNIKVIPLKVIYSEEEEYIDKINITADEIINRMPDEIPTTSLPSAEDIESILDQFVKDGYTKVLAITISSGLSGTYNLVRLLAEDYDQLDIHTVDTRSIGIGSGLHTIYATELIEAGYDWETIKEKIDSQRERSLILFHLQELSYLQKGGRIGLVSSMLGSLLNIQPIISCNEDGIYYTVSKARGLKRSINNLVKDLKDFVKEGKKVNIGVAYGSQEVKEIAHGILERLKKEIPHANQIFFDQISPVLIVHTGPSLIGASVQIVD